MDNNLSSKQAIILFASSNKNGNTAKLMQSFSDLGNFDIIDISDLKISFFDYSQQYEDDDFLPTIKKLLDYDKIIFASPVYWYSMSAQMKVFFDRFSDILSSEKELGRRIKGKDVYIVSTGFAEKPERSFEEVFINSFNYLGLNYHAMLYAACPEGFEQEANQEMIDDFYNEYFG